MKTTCLRVYKKISFELLLDCVTILMNKDEQMIKEQYNTHFFDLRMRM